MSKEFAGPGSLSWSWPGAHLEIPWSGSPPAWGQTGVPWGHPEGFLGLDVGSCWLMLAHVGSCWGHVGLRWPQVGSKIDQDLFLLAQVVPKMPKMAPKAFQVPQDVFKMASRWFPNPYVLASWSFFNDFQRCWKNATFSNACCSLGALKVSKFIDFWNNIRLILDQLWHPRSCMPQEASR